jgi:hypothetical protein
MPPDDFAATAAALAALSTQDPAERFVALFFRATDSRRCSSRHVLALVLLTGQADLMSGVARISIGHIARELGVSSPDAGKLLDDLEFAGVISQQLCGELRVVVFPAAVRCNGVAHHHSQLH